MARRKQPSPQPTVTEVAQKVHWWIYAIVGGAAAIAAATWFASIYLGHFALASTVTEHDRQLIILRTQREDDSRRIDWLVETVGQMSMHQGIAPAPVSPRHRVDDGK